MIPIKLSLQGLYSYQQEQTIDFERLMRGQLFGIFGAVGSGKSSILEAITFALYGQTDRMHQREKRNYNMMNLKSDELLIDLEFMNYAGQRYRSVVKGKRSKSNFDQVNTFDRRFFEWKQEEWLPMETNDATEILGLSYDNFRRTIIIPQGRFKEFLELGAKDRTDMLKEIFRLDKFDLQNNVRSLQARNNESLQHLSGRMQQYENLTEDLILEIGEKVKDLQTNLEKSEAQYKQWQKQVSEEEKIKNLRDRLEKEQTKLEELNSRKTYFRDLEQQLNRYEYALRYFKTPLTQLETQNRDIDRLKRELAEKEQKHKRSAAQLKNEEQSFTVLKASYDQLDNDKTRLEDLRTIEKIISTEKEREKLHKRLKDGKEAIDQKKEKVTNLQSGLTEIKTDIHHIETAIDQDQQLSEAEKWYTRQADLQSQEKEIQKDLQQQKKEIFELIHQIQKIVDPLSASVADSVDASELEAFIAKWTVPLTTDKLQKLENELKEYHLQQGLSSYSDSLEDGEPCPLCGSVHHPQVLHVENVSDAIATAEKALEREQKRLQEFNVLSTKLSWQQQTYASLTEKLNQRIADIKVHGEGFIWKDLDPNDRSKLEVRIGEWKKNVQVVKEKRKKLQEAEQELDKSVKQLEKYHEAIGSIQTEATAAEGRIAALKDHLKQVEYQEIDGESLHQDIQSLQLKIETTVSQYKQAETSIQKQKEQLADLTSAIRESQKRLAELEDRVGELKQQLEQLLKEAPFESQDEIGDLLKVDLDTTRERERLNNFEKELHKTAGDVQQLIEETKGVTFDEEAHQSLKAALTNLEEQLQKDRDATASLKARWQQMVKDQETFVLLKAEQDKLQIRGENLKKMAQLFSASGFVNYISTVYLQNLCASANDRFYRLTRQQLRLEVDDDNSFKVRDFLNDGRERSIKTLSGGQTFQASLCLALSLAESIQEQNKASQNFFFLDEGFGALDKEALRVVFDTLKALRQEDRIVGIISHVEELQQEIDNFLNIKNDEERGSQVMTSWGD